MRHAYIAPLRTHQRQRRRRLPCLATTQRCGRESGFTWCAHAPRRPRPVLSLGTPSVVWCVTFHVLRVYASRPPFYRIFIIIISLVPHRVSRPLEIRCRPCATTVLVAVQFASRRRRYKITFGRARLRVFFLRVCFPFLTVRVLIIRPCACTRAVRTVRQYFKCGALTR